MNWMKKNWTTILLVCILLLGVGIFAYPTFSDYWNSFHQSQAVTSYVENVANLDTEQYEALWNEAVAYNKKLAKTGIQWNMTDEEKEEYNEYLKVDDSGIMGYIDIPVIDCSLPIYHGTDESVLQVAIGHIEGSSLPVGGEGSHCVISGHRGLPSARLFTDLDKLVEGDIFILHTLDATLTYEVDQIRIVEPTDLSNLQIEEGKDYCTLVTCTPYGINTHRLLVRGHRIENQNATDIRVSADATQVDPVQVAPFIATPILIVLLIWVFVGGRRKR
ncbi:class C sortase [Oliverpabstia intestinalis]|uniref:class C sortase n=2 Tax=Oliverpabstia intestinalis TaxID=2606633 RepID=UPI003F8CEFFC